MKNLANKRFGWHTVLVATSFLVLTGMGKCGGGGGKDPNVVKNKVAQCVQAPATKCAEYKQNDGKTCELDPLSNKCRAKGMNPDDCQKLSDKDECQKNDECRYQNNKCEKADANEAGTCAAIKVDTFCNAHTSTKDKRICLWDAGKCINKPIVVSEYTLEKKAGYGINEDWSLAGITASEDGKFVYLIGSQPNTFKAFAVDDNNWEDALGNFTQIRDATNLQGPRLDFSGAAVTKWAPLSNGIVVWIGDKGAVQLIETGKDNSFGWKYPAAANGIGSVTKGGETFLYGSIGAQPAKSVVFIPQSTDVGAPNLTKWDDSLVENENTGGAQTPISMLYGQFLPYKDGAKNGMLMVDASGGRVDLILDGNIGLANRWIVNTRNGAPSQPGDHSGTLNYINIDPLFDRSTGSSGPIRKLAMVDKYLVAIFGTTDPGEGGIALFDTTTAATNPPMQAASWKWLNQTVDATDIAVDKVGAKKDKRAIITVKTGFIILEEDKLVEPVAGEGYISNYANTDKKAVTSGVTTAKSGFAGATLPYAIGNVAEHVYLGAAQDKNGLWYIAIKGAFIADGGVYTLDIKEITIP